MDYKAHISDDSTIVISQSDGTLEIKVVGTEQIPITEAIATEAIELLKIDPQSITIDSDGAIVKNDETVI